MPGHRDIPLCRPCCRPLLGYFVFRLRILLFKDLLAKAYFATALDLLGRPNMWLFSSHELGQSSICQLRTSFSTHYISSNHIKPNHIRSRPITSILQLRSFLLALSLSPALSLSLSPLVSPPLPSPKVLPLSVFSGQSDLPHLIISSIKQPLPPPVEVVT